MTESHLLQAVSKQAGAANALAASIELHAAESPPWESRVLDKYAQLARELAVALEQACESNDSKRLRSAWRNLGAIGIALVTGAATGATQSAPESLLGLPGVAECAAVIESNYQRAGENLENLGPTTKLDSPRLSEPPSRVELDDPVAPKLRKLTSSEDQRREALLRDTLSDKPNYDD